MEGKSNFHNYASEELPDGKVQYAFISTHEEVYHAYFYNASDLSFIPEKGVLSNGVFFGFNPVDDNAITKMDEKIKFTIFQIIDDYLLNYGSKIILFHFDGHCHDNKQRLRYRLFSAWHEVHEGNLEMETIQVVIGERVEYIGYFSEPLNDDMRDQVKSEIGELKYNLLSKG